MPLASELAVVQRRCLEFSNSAGDIHSCKEFRNDIGLLSSSVLFACKSFLNSRRSVADDCLPQRRWRSGVTLRLCVSAYGCSGSVAQQFWISCFRCCGEAFVCWYVPPRFVIVFHVTNCCKTIKFIAVCHPSRLLITCTSLHAGVIVHEVRILRSY